MCLFRGIIMSYSHYVTHSTSISISKSQTPRNNFLTILVCQRVWVSAIYWESLLWHRKLNVDFLQQITTNKTKNKNFKTNGRLCRHIGGKSNVEIDAQAPAVTALQVSLQSDLELSKLSVWNKSRRWCLCQIIYFKKEGVVVTAGIYSTRDYTYF